MLCFDLVLLTTVLLVVPVSGKLRLTPIRISGLDTQAGAVSLVSLFVRHMSRFVRRRTRGSESSELLFDTFGPFCVGPTVWASSGVLVLQALFIGPLFF